MKILKEIIPYIFIIIIVVFIRTLIITPAKVDGDSMKSTLYDGEIVFINKISLRTEGINRFDMVVIKQDDDLLIKRIIGMPGEEIQYINDELYINSKKMDTPIDFEKTKDFSGIVKENEYFVLGDNRDDSKDSRYFGGVSKNSIKGKVRFVLLPFKHFGKVE